MPLSTWELFREELERNVQPKETEIQEQFKFLSDFNLCDGDTCANFVQVRYMAAYEQVINEYLHPPLVWKQGNVKSELLHLGTIYEGLLSISLKALIDNGIVREKDVKNDVRKAYNQFKKGRSEPSFNQLIIMAKDYSKLLGEPLGSNLKDVLGVADELRKERNKVHLKAISPSGVDSLSIFPIKYRDKIPKEPDKFKAPLAEVDSSLPPGYPYSRGSLPSVSVSPGLVDQIAFEDQVRPNCFFLSEVGLLQ
ncbi:MAG: hypothetical protein ISS66_20255 [Desulfobacteraceae bacterium]|nr:hypothetical protein [Desulfobacteraceae bacterium]